MRWPKEKYSDSFIYTIRDSAFETVRKQSIRFNGVSFNESPLKRTDFPSPWHFVLPGFHCILRLDFKNKVLKCDFLSLLRCRR